MGDVVADFCAITGESEDSAINYLTASDFNLETAAQLFFAAHGGAQTDQPRQAPRQQQAPQASGGASHQHVSRLFDDEGHSRGPNDGGDDFSHLVGQSMQAMEAAMQFPLGGGAFQGMFGGTGGGGNRGRAPRVSPRVEVLPSDDEDGDDGAAEPERPNRDIANLFRAPRYAYQGGFQECCQNAVAKERLVILNILRRGDFRSGCLNRDIWADTLVKEMVPQMCNVFQVLHDSDEGQLLTSTYRLSSGSIPCLLVVNPLTRAVVHEMNVARLVQANGVWNVTTFLDELTTFVSQHASVFNRVITDEEDPSRQSSVEPMSPPGGRARGDGDDEDAQLARALAESERMALEEEVVRSVSGPALKQSKVEKPTNSVTPRTEATSSAAPPSAPTAPPPPPPPLAPIAPTPVDISQYLNPQGNDKYHLRFRVPSGSLEVDVSGRIPVERLVAYVAFHIHSTNQATYPAPPQIELRGGFPPKPLAFPEGDATLTLADWGLLRQNDNVLVHLA